MNQQTNSQRGFTLIELMLAMAFVSALLVMVALTAIQVGKLYDRGLTLKTVNQAGRDLSDSFKRDLSAARQSDVVYVVRNDDKTLDLHRLCLGNYSYVWNYGERIGGDNDKTEVVSYREAAGKATDRPVRLARVSDPGGRYCQAGEGDNYPVDVNESEATELLAGTDQQLAIHNFEFSTIASDSAISQAVYSLSFTLGTNDQSVLETGSEQCKPPSDDSNLEFCAVNKFEMVVRASGV